MYDLKNFWCLSYKTFYSCNFVDAEFIGLVKTSNFSFNEPTVAKNEFVEPFI